MFRVWSQERKKNGVFAVADPCSGAPITIPIVPCRDC